MSNVVDSIPGIEKLNKATQSEPDVGLNLKDGMSIKLFNQRRAYKNRTQVIDYEYYTSNQYVTHNYRMFMKQNQPHFTATNDLIKNILIPKIKTKHLKLKPTPFQKFEIEKQNKQRKLNQIKSNSSIHSSIQLTISSSRSCSSEKSILKTSPLSKSNTNLNYNKTILKKKLVLFPDIIRKYKIITANTHVFSNIQKTSYKNKKVNLFLTNMKY